MYIFLSVFSVYHDTGDDKRPGKHLRNRVCQILLLLRQKIGIPRIHFEQLVHIPETVLCVPDLLVNLLQKPW